MKPRAKSAAALPRLPLPPLLLLAWTLAAAAPPSGDPPTASGNLLESRTGPYSSPTQDGLRSPVATTAPPVSLLNHHSAYRGPHGQQGPFRPGSWSGSWSSSWSSSKATFSTLLDNATPPSGGSSATARSASVVSTEANAGENQRRRRSSSDEEETTTFITTTTTTVESPGHCQLDLGGPEGYVEAPPTSGPASDCSYTVTVAMGYGVEVQVMKADLLDGDQMTFEDSGGGGGALANETVLMRGLVVRSRSNQIRIRLHSRRPHPGSVLLRYQAFALSCVFPRRPAHGDVSVSGLHSGAKAFFSCLPGYRLQGLRVLTCRNASTPYWSGKEPQCLASCGGVISNATVGRIVSPGFPGNYSDNLTCHWLLEAPRGHRLHLHFEKVALAEDDDRLLIRNGNSAAAAALYDSYQVEYLPNEGLLASSGSLLLEMTTDPSGTSTGFAVRYQAFAAGHCYQPFVKYGNLTSSDATWAVGAVVEFACRPGYTLEQGSVTIECVDAANPQWNETEPACRAVCSGETSESAGVVLSPNWPEAYDRGQDCIWGIHVDEDKRIMLEVQVLNIGTNDLVTFYDGDDLTAKVLGQYGGSRASFKLYTSTADATIQFQSDPATNVFGYGSGFVVHFFEVPRNDTCPELPEISSGWRSASRAELVQGAAVTYQCYPGYQLLGPERLVCQWDLSWSGDLPSCQRVVTCPDPGQVENGRRLLSGPRFTAGSSVQYVCNEGFRLSGNSLLSCLGPGASGPRWSQKLPRCLPEAWEPCGHPGTPTYGVPSSTRLRFQPGETLRYSCLPGHQLLGEPLLRCVPGHPSRWSGLPPVCKANPAQTRERGFAAASSADVTMETAQAATFIPVSLLVILVLGIYLHYTKVQRKSSRLCLSFRSPYQNINQESKPEPSEDTREYEVSI